MTKKSPAGYKPSTQKTATPSRLGRGLSSLLGDAAIPAKNTPQPQAANPTDMELSTMVAQATGSASSVRSIPVEWINPGPWQPRRIFDTQALNELAVSIRQKGLIQPILVRETPDKENRYQLIAGERRWRAAQIAKLHEIPAIIGVFDERDASEISLIENVQRRDLTSIEEAEAYQALISSHDYTQEELADIIGKSRSHITNLMRLLNLPVSVQELISEGRLTMGQVRPLIGHQDAAAFAQKILTDNLSARQVERLIKDLKSGVKAETKKPEKSSDIRALEDRAMQILGLSLSLSWDDAKEQGKLSISMSSLEQLDDLMLRLGLVDDSPS